ncbi:MAG: sigma-70 family RNA polymerase sigma factor [Archangium sp.]|nr:sigma-70 family RNA polymerase sigma factor [Archangium sp.]MDP3154588.1 sigma-70 family RNA polymerase sigma factor [Archangium sp.]MDP3574338.1 sigma-70 family RNA polymerase sigma factor [Archangium sp.]
MERSELAELYTRYGYLVHQRCSALLRNDADAADALQDTFCRVQKYGKPPGVNSTLAWLYSVASNCCFDGARKRNRERPQAEEVLARAPGAHVGAAGDGDRRAVVGAILGQFDAQTREMGVLHHLDGMTQEEIAAQTGFSRKTVGKKLALFEQAFKKHWNKANGVTS